MRCLARSIQFLLIVESQKVQEKDEAEQIELIAGEQSTRMERIIHNLLLCFSAS